MIPAPQASSAPTDVPPLRFGIYPGGPAGSVDPKASPRPENPAKRLAALQGLRGRSPFVVRLYVAWTGDARADDLSGWLDAEVREYTHAGMQVELVVRYKPTRPVSASPAAFAEFIRRVVRRYGPDAGFTSLQVTNEANLTDAPEASDGAFAGATQALVDGVVAAKDEARRGGHAHLGVGFNWAYDERPAASSVFWTRLGRLGGRPFARSVDWVGLDTYPGTWAPQLAVSGSLPERAGDAVQDALRALRDCHLPRAGLGRATKLHVAENGFPTGAGRGDDLQSEVLDAMVRAVDAVRATYGVSDYRWFDLRDSSTADSSLESHYGITRDDYTPKAAYRTYRELIEELGGDADAPSAQEGQARAPAAGAVTTRGTRCLSPRVRLALGRHRGKRVTALKLRFGRLVVALPAPRRLTRALGLSLASGRISVRLHLRVVAAGRARARVIRRDLRIC